MINIMYNFQSMIERDYFEGLVTQHLILLVYHVNSWKNNYSLCIKWCLVLELALWACCSVSQSCLTLCDPMDCNMPGLPVHHQLLEFTQTHVHWVGDAIQSSHPLSSPSPPALSISQHKGLFKRVSSSHQVAKVLEFQLQHQSFQWAPRTDLL